MIPQPSSRLHKIITHVSRLHQRSISPSNSTNPSADSLYRLILSTQMASQPQRNPRLFFPFIFGVSQDQPSESGERVIFINALTQTVVLMGSSDAYDDLIPQKSSRRPASKASIAAMPSVEVVSGENSDGECAVCLEGWEGGETVKEMPCKHRFHGDCIERWLSINGCCPVCRHQMTEEDVDRDEAETERRRRRRGIWVSFSFGGGGRSSDENHDSSHDHPQTQN